MLEDDVYRLVAQTRYDFKIVLKCLREVRKEEREMEKIALEVIHWCLYNKQNLIWLLGYMKFLLVFTHLMRRPCWCTKQWQNVAHVLHNNRIKFPRLFSQLFCTRTWPPGRHVKSKNYKILNKGSRFRNFIPVSWKINVAGGFLLSTGAAKATCFDAFVSVPYNKKTHVSFLNWALW